MLGQLEKLFTAKSIQNCNPVIVYIILFIISLVSSLNYVTSDKHTKEQKIKVVIIKLVSSFLMMTLLLWLCSMNWRKTAWFLLFPYFFISIFLVFLAAGFISLGIAVKTVHKIL